MIYDANFYFSVILTSSWLITIAYIVKWEAGFFIDGRIYDHECDCPKCRRKRGLIK